MCIYVVIVVLILYFLICLCLSIYFLSYTLDITISSSVNGKVDIFDGVEFAVELNNDLQTIVSWSKK